MKKAVLLLAVAITSMSFINWHYNLDEAKATAKKEHKHILLNFSGSDWCGPCIRLHKEILGSDAFQKFATGNLVLVNADFPRMKKNQLSKEQQKINDALADQYNSKGNFPLTLLLNENGKIVKQWEGLPSATPEEFTEEVQFAIDQDK
ncbi:thioredoxin family protein [Ferruginibacter paludis]|uniref:thioredoxin family protein n=1 Tax=Ferruginibacter paludis TaxID=1310417 RepID=UPI0025B2DF03|nr:thioredoxin family protein [Ferruginibacter paludis]MDN3655188.1 thioredoxin family protein [Ferruginibacter paludis]